MLQSMSGCEEYEYTINDHKHRFSAWAASRAASTSVCRFNVEKGRKIIEDAGINKITSLDKLPKKNPDITGDTINKNL